MSALGDRMRGKYTDALRLSETGSHIGCRCAGRKGDRQPQWRRYLTASRSYFGDSFG